MKAKNSNPSKASNGGKAQGGFKTGRGELGQPKHGGKPTPMSQRVGTPADKGVNR